MDTVTQKVIEKLKKYEIQDYNELRPHTQKLLIEIESYMDKSFKERVKSIDILKNQKININKIIENTSISKGTIYNNVDIFKKYIDESISEYDEIEKKDYNPNKNEDILNLNNELNKKIDKLTIGLIEMNDLKLAYEKLMQENKKLIKENNILINEREKLSIKIRNHEEQSKQLTIKENNIIDMR